MGNSLVTIKLTDNVTWADGDIAWRDASLAYFISASMLRTSMYDYVGRRYWSDDIIQYTPPRFDMPTVHGGFCRMEFGQIVLSLNIFSGLQSSGNSMWTDTDDTEWNDENGIFVTDDIVTGDPLLWPPPREIYVNHKYTEDDEDGLVVLMDGVGHLTGFDRESVTYDLYGQNYTQELLETTTDYNDEEVPIPRIFGAVEYVQVLRLPDDDLSHPVYHKQHIAGTKGTDWHVFDDGVNIDANVTDNGDGTFYLSVSPVGEVTISGTGEIETLSDLFAWAFNSDPDAEKIPLSYSYDSALEADPSPAMSYCATGQTQIIDFVSTVAAYFGHLCYVSGATLIAVDLAKDNGSETLTEYDFFTGRYDYPAPIAKITAAWQKAESVEETIGQYVKRTDEEETVLGDYSYGSEETLTPYQTTRADIKTRLEETLEYKQADQISVSVPISDALPVPGKKLTYTDASSFKLPLSVDMHCRSLQYDFVNETVEITGEGTLG